MNEELKAFVDKHKAVLYDGWTIDQKASELAMWAIEEGLADLPELDMLNGTVQAQQEFDRAVEEAYTWLLGECKEYLK